MTNPIFLYICTTWKYFDSHQFFTLHKNQNKINILNMNLILYYLYIGM